MIWPSAVNNSVPWLIAVLAGAGVLLSVLWIFYRVHYQKPMQLSNLLILLMQWLRAIIGWPLLIVGVIMTPLPIPIGIPMIVVATFLIGTRSRFIRLSLVTIKRLLRRWARIQTPVIGPTGRFVLRRQYQFTLAYRNYRRAHTARRLRKMQRSSGDIRAHKSFENTENETPG